MSRWRLPVFLLVSLPVLLVAAAGSPAKGTPAILVYEKSVSPQPGAPAWIWRASVNGSHRKRLLRGHNPSVSPDGRTIAFTRGHESETMDQLWLMRSDGTHARVVVRASGGFNPIVWSPDSSHVLAGAWGGLRLVDRRQGRVRELAGTEQYSERVSFSPDGRQITYERADQTGADVFVVSTSGGSPRRLTHDHKSYAPLWGPSRIAYLRGRGFLDGDIWLMDGDGAHNERLTTTAAGYYPAAWSRSGRRLLGANPAIHNGRLWALDVPSGRARPVTKWVGDLFPQGLSRDELLIYAAVGCGGVPTSRGFLETIPFAGGPPRVIVRGPCRGSWSR